MDDRVPSIPIEPAYLLFNVKEIINEELYTKGREEKNQEKRQLCITEIKECFFLKGTVLCPLQTKD